MKARRYLDCRKRALSPLFPVCNSGAMRGVQSNLTGTVVAIAVPCEHCDGERSPLVRYDELRGVTCKDCDSSLDTMFEEAT